MKKPTKIKLEIKGEMYNLPISALNLRENSSRGEQTHIHMGAKSTASIIKQFVKKNFGDIKVWATSKSYSGGSSSDIFISNSNGAPLDDGIYKKIKQFADTFKAGSFDGMYDTYNYREDAVETDNGTPLKYFPSYVSVQNRPKWGSVEYWMADYREYLENSNNDEYAVQHIQTEAKGGWLEYNKTYMNATEFRRVKRAMQSILNNSK